MPARVAAACAVMLLFAAGARAADTTWDKNAEWLQQQIKACAQRAGGYVCTYFAARALNQLFGIAAFCTSDRCSSPQEVVARIAQDKQWTALGKASDQGVLSRAQQMATGGMPVVAAMAGSDSGVFGIIMPGGLVNSRSWGKKVPLAVGARLDKPEGSIYSRPLSFLFSDPSKVALYVQK